MFLRADEPVILQPASRGTVERLNESLTRAGFPALATEQFDADACVDLILSEAAARRVAAADDPIRSPMATGSVTDPAVVTATTVAKERGITEEQAEDIHLDRDLSYAELLTMPNRALRAVIFEQEREEGDHPEEAMRFEESFKLDKPAS